MTSLIIEGTAMRYSMIVSVSLVVVILSLQCNGSFVTQKVITVVMPTLLSNCQAFVNRRSTEYPGNGDNYRPWWRRPFWDRFWRYDDGRHWHYDNGRTSANASVGTSPYDFPAFSAGVRHRGDGWTGRGYGNFDAGGNWDMGGRLDFDRDNWNGGINGTADSDGNFNFQARFEFGKRRKRSTPLIVQRFNVTLQADPCNFNVYDIDRNDVITMYEILRIFGLDKNAENLFSALDFTIADGMVERKEFMAMAPRVISECQSE